MAVEGKYTIIGSIAGVLCLLIAAWQLVPGSKKDISGTWKMTSVVESAAMTKYIGMKTEWIVHLAQSGDQISGSAEKIAVDNVPLDFKARNAMSINGKLSVDKFVLSYIEHGRLRETKGSFSGILKKKTFEGNFISTASDSKGRISAVKME